VSANSAVRIAVLPGDGIGVEVMAPCLRALDAAASRVGGFSLDWGIRPFKIGGQAGTEAITVAVLKRISGAEAAA